MENTIHQINDICKEHKVPLKLYISELYGHEYLKCPICKKEEDELEARFFRKPNTKCYKHNIEHIYYYNETTKIGSWYCTECVKDGIAVFRKKQKSDKDKVYSCKVCGKETVRYKICNECKKIKHKQHIRNYHIRQGNTNRYKELSQMDTNKQKLESFTSANVKPIKLLKHPEFTRIKECKKIKALHVSFNPTNKCNLNCSFCSCANEDKNLEFNILELDSLIYKLKTIGTEAITITGGGEPLKHPHISKIIKNLTRSNVGFSVGLVSNGYLLDSEMDFINQLKWFRISCSDEKDFDVLAKKLSLVDEKYKTDYALSYVVSENPNIENLIKAINYVNKKKYTHIRIVEDIHQALDNKGCSIQDLRLALDKRKINLSNAIFQARKNPVSQNKCLLCYLKPVISPDLKVYYCCGVQYAEKEHNRRMPDSLCHGTLKKYADFYSNTDTMVAKPVNCAYCYYSEYNKTLEELMKAEVDTIRHKEFV